MKDFKKKLIKKYTIYGIIGILLTVATIFDIHKFMDYKKRSTVRITGTVFGKNVSTETHKHSTDEIYLFAVHPDNKSRFNDFDVQVTFVTYCSYDIGDKVTFNDIWAANTDKQWTSSDSTWDTVTLLLIFLFGFLIIVYIVCLCSDIQSDISEYKDMEKRKKNY